MISTKEFNSVLYAPDAKKTRICAALSNPPSNVALDDGTFPCFVPAAERMLCRPAIKLMLLLTDFLELPATFNPPEIAELGILGEDAVERRHRVLL